MPAPLRLALALATLTTFWLALFVPGAADTTPASVPAATPDGLAVDVHATERDADAAHLEGLLAASREAVDAGRWQEALGPTKEIVERFPTQFAYLEQLARIYHELDRPVDEAAAWEAFMDRAPTVVDACPHIGHAYRRLGKPDRALNAFERCLAADPASAELAFLVGLANEWMARLGPAQTYYERAIALATTHYDSEVGLARLRLHRNQVADALARASAVLSRNPTHVDALLVAGLAEQRAGRRPEARAHLETAARLSEDYFDVQLALGVLDYSESRYADARVRFERASTLDPTRHDEVRLWLERTDRAKRAS